MNMSSVVGGGFRGASAPNSFTGVFPMGARVPTRPNPLTQPGKAVQGKADVAGIQAAQAKRASDKRKVKYDEETGLTGQDAVDTLPKYMKSAGLNEFQANFLSRLVRTGMDEAQIRHCVKQAGAEFGSNIETELNEGIDKLAGVVGFLGGGLKALPGMAVSAGKALGSKAVSAGKALGSKAVSAFKSTPAKIAPIMGKSTQVAPAISSPAVKAIKAAPGQALRATRATGKAISKTLPAVGGLAAGSTPLLVDYHMRAGRDDVKNNMNQLVYGSIGENGKKYPGLIHEADKYVDGINNSIDRQGEQLRSQIGSVTNPLSGLLGGFGKAKNYLQANPHVAAALLAGGGAGLGGLIGGRKGALIGGAGLPLAYLASQGQFGDLSGKLKGLMGGQDEADTAKQQAAQDAAAQSALLQLTQERAQQQAQQQAQPAVENRNELGANQIQLPFQLPFQPKPY